jgi:hypothetical protein
MLWRSRGSGCIDPRFLDLKTSWRGVVSFTPPVTLPPKETGPSSHWIGGWVVPKAGLDDMRKWKFFIPLGLEFWPVTSRYTYCAVPICFSTVFEMMAHHIRTHRTGRCATQLRSSRLALRRRRNGGYPNQGPCNFLRSLREYPRILRELHHDRCFL